mmetsp:Transcript_31189/g.50035  ORF Transcript_31189/g.50035 Transcript_31189/m.50035 type:complete len:240 (-) Transcript_31189:558-1277(-)
MECAWDSDCPGAMVCHSTGLCQCLKKYGWMGQDCLEFGPFAVFTLCVSPISSVLSMIATFMSIWDASKWLTIGTSRRRSMISNEIFTMVLTAVASLAFCVKSIIWIMAVINPEEVVTRQYHGYSKFPAMTYKISKFDTLELDVGMTLITLVMLLAIVHVAAIWPSITKPYLQVATVEKPYGCLKWLVLAFDISVLLPIFLCLSIFNDYQGYCFFQACPDDVCLGTCICTSQANSFNVCV